MDEPSLVFVFKDAESAVGRMAKPVRSRDPLENLEEKEKNACVDEPDHGGEWGVVGTVMAKEWHESDMHV